MAEEVQRLRDAGMLEERARQIIGIDLKIIAVGHGTGVAEDEGEYSIKAAAVDIDRHLEQAGRRLAMGCIRIIGVPRGIGMPTR